MADRILRPHPRAGRGVCILNAIAWTAAALSAVCPPPGTGSTRQHKSKRKQALDAIVSIIVKREFCRSDEIQADLANVQIDLCLTQVRIYLTELCNEERIARSRPQSGEFYIYSLAPIAPEGDA